MAETVQHGSVHEQPGRRQPTRPTRRNIPPFPSLPRQMNDQVSHSRNSHDESADNHSDDSTSGEGNLDRLEPEEPCVELAEEGHAAASTKKSPCRCASSIRLQAMSKYFGSRSIPMKLRPICTAATPVVPLPINGSRMVSVAMEQRATSRFINS